MFFCDDDYLLYLTLLGETARRFGVRLQGYSLMSNHVHLLPIPVAEDALARVMGLVHQRYSQSLNLRARQTGHCWQNRFFSCPLDDTYVLRALRYIERNPARAGLVVHPCDYRWSSALAHCTGEDPTGLLDLTDWTINWPGETWREYLALPEVPGEVETLRLSTTLGRPLGSETFVNHLEEQTGRRLHPYSVGRPRKERDNTENRGQ